MKSSFLRALGTTLGIISGLALATIIPLVIIISVIAAIGIPYWLIINYPLTLISIIAMSIIIGYLILSKRIDSLFNARRKIIFVTLSALILTLLIVSVPLRFDNNRIELKKQKERARIEALLNDSYNESTKQQSFKQNTDLDQDIDQLVSISSDFTFDDWVYILSQIPLDKLNQIRDELQEQSTEAIGVE